jgi:hypothetical protein
MVSYIPKSDEGTHMMHIVNAYLHQLKKTHVTSKGRAPDSEIRKLVYEMTVAIEKSGKCEAEDEDW